MRVSTRPALERILAIDSAVRRRDWPNARTLARELEVVRRTIQRDIEFMRDRLGAPLEFDSVRNGYFYTDPSYRLAYFPVTEGELVALLISAQVMDQYRGTPFERDLRKAMAKVSKSLPDTIEVSLDELTNYLSVLPRVRTTYDPEIFRVLVRAVSHSRQLSMVYWTASPESSVIYNPEGKISQEKLENPAGFWNNVEENTFSLFQNKGAFE